MCKSVLGLDTWLLPLETQLFCFGTLQEGKASFHSSLPPTVTPHD